MADENRDKNRQPSRIWGLIGGGLLVILGIIAFNAAATTSVLFVFVLGWILVIGGLVGLIASFAADGGGAIFAGIISAILALLAGIIVLSNPAASLAFLTILLGTYFVIDGIVRAVAGISGSTSHRIWAVISGVIIFLLGIGLWTNLLTASLVVFGILIGVSLILRGATVMAASLSRTTEERTHAPRYQ